MKRRCSPPNDALNYNNTYCHQRPQCTRSPLNPHRLDPPAKALAISLLRSLPEFDSVEMASKLHQFGSKAVQVSEFISKHGKAYYEELLEKNKQHIVQPPTIEACQDLSKKFFYTRLAR
ncbi:hypothetical protein C4D60_Mb05t08640 [Musa balbisiana]|uniref:Uncharacterized protein n=1 Tax=Musa balbisiana TaxID=52838 RepID=A0A4S8JUM4_MUSBA|nr:hypothetical protein C4D60_Mb05t08640 [Musa balbisiana]